MTMTLPEARAGYGWYLLADSSENRTSVEIAGPTTVPPRAILVFSFALLALRFGQLFYRIVTGRETRLALGDEAAEALRLQEEMGLAERGKAPPL